MTDRQVPIQTRLIPAGFWQATWSAIVLGSIFQQSGTQVPAIGNVERFLLAGDHSSATLDDLVGLERFTAAFAAGDQHDRLAGTAKFQMFSLRS